MAYYGPRVRPQTYGGISNLTDALAKLPGIYGKSKLAVSKLETEEQRRTSLDEEGTRRDRESLTDALERGYVPEGYSIEEPPAAQPGVVDDRSALGDYLTPGNVDLPNQAPPSAEAALAKGAATKYYQNIIGPDGKIAGQFDTRNTIAGQEEARIRQRDERRAFERGELEDERQYEEGRYKSRQDRVDVRDVREHEQSMERYDAGQAARRPTGAQVTRHQGAIVQGYGEYLLARNPEMMRAAAREDPDRVIRQMRLMIERGLEAEGTLDLYGGPALDRLLRDNLTMFLEDDSDTGSTNLLDGMKDRFGVERAVPMDTTGGLGSQDMQRRLAKQADSLGIRTRR